MPAVGPDLPLGPEKGSRVRGPQTLDKVDQGQGVAHLALDKAGRADADLAHIGTCLGHPDDPWRSPERGLIPPDQAEALQNCQAAVGCPLPH